MNLIQKYATYLSVLCYLLLIDFCYHLYLAGTDLIKILPHFQIIPLWLSIIELSSWLLGSMIPALLKIAAAVYLIRLMRYFAKGETFSSTIIMLMQKIYRISLLCLIISFMGYTFRLEHFGDGHGRFSLALSFTDSDFFNIMLIMLLALIIAILRSGNELKIEQELTV